MQLIRYAAIALVGIALLLGVVLYLNRGSQVRLEGKILKTRVIATDENSCAVVVDFRVSNPSNVLFVVSDTKVILTAADGSPVEGLTAAEVDLDRLLDYYKAAGPRYNPVLKPRDRFTSGQREDRTMAASFPLREAEVMARRNLTLRIRDVDGAVVELAEK